MARKRIPRGPHRVGDSGWRHEHRHIRQQYQIGDDITIVVSREAGRQVVVIKAPPTMKIQRVDETDLQNAVSS
jgi:hypothetical protein